MSIDYKEAERINRAHWDEIAPVHLKSYGIDDLLSGVSRIDNIQKQELYPVKGKDLIHLQCHIGTDTISLSFDGANVTGVDFSSESIKIAKELSLKLHTNTKFIEANVLDLKEITTTTYDVVYTSKGILSWISDINRWAETIAFLLKEDGIFYIMEIHPVLYMFDDTNTDDLKIKYSYFNHNNPIHFDDDHPDYSDSTYIPTNKTYEWIWSLSDVINALIHNGLIIEMINEYYRLFYQALPEMVLTEDGWWILPKYNGMIPLMFTLRARKKLKYGKEAG